MQQYVASYGEIEPGCVTDFYVHCFNSTALSVLKDLGVHRATLHPELNLAQMRDIQKPIDTEAVIYGKVPLMKLGNPQISGTISDRKNVNFFVKGGVLYNSVPIFVADKLKEIEKSGITHGRLIFTTESAEEVHAIIKAYMYRKTLNIEFTRGKFYTKV
ncbi:MAG: U32 family peptidase [Oscillospiraceae bacterium]|nr:U32 family peptidase [Oscillospiraceae bacterium]